MLLGIVGLVIPPLIEEVRLQAELEREQERLNAQVQQAEARRRVSEIESETQAAHLQRLEAMLAEFPQPRSGTGRANNWKWCARWQPTPERVVQLGHLSDVARTVLATEVNDCNAPR